jgi:hypothetical protein
LAVGAVLAVGSAALAQAKAPPVAKPCPPVKVIESTLAQPISRLSQSNAAYSDGQGVDGARRTCTYITKKGSTIIVMLSAGAQVLGFVDAEDAAFEANTGYQDTQKTTKKLIPVFGSGNDAWAVKGGGSLSALYKTDAIVILAPHTTVKQLKALAQATLGIPSATAKGV